MTICLGARKKTFNEAAAKNPGVMNLPQSTYSHSCALCPKDVQRGFNPPTTAPPLFSCTSKNRLLPHAKHIPRHVLPVVYFNQQLGAAHNQKLVEILFSAVFNHVLVKDIEATLET